MSLELIPTGGGGDEGPLYPKGRLKLSFDTAQMPNPLTTPTSLHTLLQKTTATTQAALIAPTQHHCLPQGPWGSHKLH